MKGPMPQLPVTTPARVTVRLSGGLGNQMFQYAFGRAVAESASAPLFLDVSSGFAGDPYGRSVSLSRLPIVAGYRTPELNWFARMAAARRAPCRVVAGLQNLGAQRGGGERIYRERGLFEFDPAVFAPTAAVVYAGYWQHPRYFESVAASLRSELSASIPLNDYARGILERIRGTESVAVHVRNYERADRERFKKRRTDHLTLPPAYYQQALGIMDGKIAQPLCLVFSDDPAVDLSVFGTRSVLRVEARSIGDDVAEQWLMSQCRHQIVANSTFSWWAAWLNKHPGKCVVAPRHWFGDPLPAWNLLPKDWMVVA
jgi:hypothetical protein